MKVLRPLNLLPYNRGKAIKTLKEIGWREYGRKHSESIFTKFFQNFYLPARFGYDKRRPHLSSMILTGEISRNQALEELNKPLYDEVELRQDKKFVIKKLGLNEAEFEQLMNAPIRKANEFPSYERLYNSMKKLQSFLEHRWPNLIFSKYS